MPWIFLTLRLFKKAFDTGFYKGWQKYFMGKNYGKELELKKVTGRGWSGDEGNGREKRPTATPKSFRLIELVQGSQPEHYWQCVLNNFFCCCRKFSRILGPHPLEASPQLWQRKTSPGIANWVAKISPGWAQQLGNVTVHQHERPLICYPGILGIYVKEVEVLWS